MKLKTFLNQQDKKIKTMLPEQPAPHEPEEPPTSEKPQKTEDINLKKFKKQLESYTKAQALVKSSNCP